MKDLLQKLLILRSPGIGAVKYKKLLTEYGDLYSAVDSLHLSDDFIDSVKSEIETANNLGIEYFYVFSVNALSLKVYLLLLYPHKQA